VKFNDFLGDCQTDPISLKLSPGVESLENGKDTVGILFFNAYTVISNGEDPFTILLNRRYINVRSSSLAEFDGIAYEILKQLPYLARFCHDCRQRVAGHGCPAFHNRGIQVGKGLSTSRITIGESQCLRGNPDS